MPMLFETTTIRSMSLTNRFVRSATWEGMANEDGSCPRKLTDLMVRLAEGGVGLIITSHAYVSREGQAGPGQLGIYSDGLVQGLAAMADAVHNAGGKIAVQLAHAGCHADPNLTGQAPLGPSSIQGEGMPNCRMMTGDDFRMVAEAFGKAATRGSRGRVRWSPDTCCPRLFTESVSIAVLQQEKRSIWRKRRKSGKTPPGSCA